MKVEPSPIGPALVISAFDAPSFQSVSLRTSAIRSNAVAGGQSMLSCSLIVMVSRLPGISVCLSSRPTHFVTVLLSQ